MLNWINKNQAYVLGALIIIGSLLILLTGLEINDVPTTIWYILNAIGFGAVRNAINAMSANDNNGWKTHAAAVGIFVLGLLNMLGYAWPPEILTAFEGLGIVGLTDAVKKISKE